MTLTEVAALPWCDVELESIRWDDQGRDIVIWLRVPWETPQARFRVLACRWAEAVTIRLATPDGKGGYPLTWDASFNGLPDGRCSIDLNFASAGGIQLVCAELELTPQSELSNSAARN